MKHLKLLQRAMAILLLICLLGGMLPIGVWATEAPADSTAELQEDKPDTRSPLSTSDLINQINNLKIPSVTQVNNWDSLDGLYFMAEATTWRTFDYRKREKSIGYLNIGDDDTALTQKWGLASVPISISGGRVKINGADADLTHAVRIFRNTYEMDDTLKTTLNNRLKDELAATVKNSSNSNYNGKTIHSLLNVKDYTTIDVDLNKYTYNIQFNNNTYLRFGLYEGIENPTTTTYPMLLHPSTNGNLVKLYKTNYNGVKNSSGNLVVSSYWVGVDAYGDGYYSGAAPYVITAGTGNQLRRNNYGGRTNWQWNHGKFYSNWAIYKVATQTLDLYNTLRGSTIKNFIANGKPANCSEEGYYGFLTTVKQSIDYYNDNYTNTGAGADVTNQCKAYCDILTKSITLLNREATDKSALNALNADPNSYMDVPITLLDFRADGLMFENMNSSTPYTLSSYASDVEATLKNAIGLPHPGRNDGLGARIDLTLDKLVDGYPVYREETVAYIAKCLMKQYQFSDHLVDGNFDKYWNKTFGELAKTGFPDTDNDGEYGEGKWEWTIAKTSTKTNGGVLKYSQIETAFDLAYYMLNNIWRPVPAEDTLLSSQTVNNNTFPVRYNMVVPELTTLRLKKEGNFYTFDSNLDVGRDLQSGIIFNTTTADDGKAPKLNVLTDLGFEHYNYYGNDATGAKGDCNAVNSTYSPRVNYSYGLHARIVFTYYDGKNQQFTFKGDDDVYFFINGVLACDVGGMHSEVTKSMKMDDLASKLDLYDGDLCTFDMFFVDRHTSGINLYFSTNIEMMTETAVTREDQYAYTEPGVLGADIREASVVEDQTEIGYNYKLFNRGNYGLNHVSFTDSKLGITLSKDTFTLNNRAAAEELTLCYRSHNPITATFSTTTPVVYKNETYEDFYDLIKEAMEDTSTITPLGDQILRISGLTGEQIMELLKLGIPANCQLEIWGMHQTALSDTGGCSSEVRTLCYPLDSQYVQGTALAGRASRSVQVKAKPSVTVNGPLQIVMDYGKTVEIPFEDMYFTLEAGGGATVELLGLTREGEHGTTTTDRPSNLKCAKEGDKYLYGNGVYEFRNNMYRFTPNSFLEKIQRINAVYSVSIPNAVDSWYIMVSVEILPATSVYYEAEDFTDTEFAYEEQTENGYKDTFDIRRQEDSGKVKDSVLSKYINSADPTYDEDILFFGFNNITEDRLRYQKNPIYGGEQIDTTGEWWYDSTIKSLSIANGNLTFTGNSTNTFIYVGSGKDGSGNRNYPLRYTTSEDDWMEIRFRINGTAASGDMHFKLELFHENSTTVSHHFNQTYYMSPTVFLDGYYVISDFIGRRTLEDTTTVAGSVTKKSYTELDRITRVNLLFGGLATGTNQTISIDYFYMGPKESRPSAQGSHLLFDFTNSTSAQYRYQSDGYNRTNYDTVTNWEAVGASSSAVTGGAMKLTPSSTTDSACSIRTKAGLSYLPSARDYCQVRLKVENVEALDPSSPYFTLRFSPDGGEMTEDTMEFCSFKLPEDRVGEWFTLTFPITNPRWYEAGVISSLSMELGGMKSVENQTAVCYMDYCYIGPSQGTSRIFTKSEKDRYNRDDIVYFDFTGDPEDGIRYDNSLYQHTNYDNPAKWFSNTNRNTVAVANGSLQLKFKAPYNSTTDGTSYNCSPFAQAVIDFNQTGVPALNYNLKPNDIIRTRIRFVNCDLRDDSTAIYVYYFADHTPDSQHGVLPNDFLSAEIDTDVVTSGEWITVTIIPYGAYSNAKVINTLRLTFPNVISAGNQLGTIEVDYLYAGPAELDPNNETYGYDSSYEDDRGLSDGESLFIEGKGVKTNANSTYSLTTFSFTGTGFDLISRTGANQATLRVTVTNAAGKAERTMTVNTKGELDLYQIPVVSIKDLPYGRYTVTIDVNKAVQYTGVLAPLSRGGEFHLDAVRIYNPIDTHKDTLTEDEQSVLAAYMEDMEAYPYVKEVRDILLSATEFSAMSGSIEGAVFVDQVEETTATVTNPTDVDENGDPIVTTVNPDIEVDDHITGSIITYEKVGPKNEVYLDANQSVAFKLCLNTVEIPLSIDIGAKAIYDSGTPILAVGHTTSTDGTVTLQTQDIRTNTAMYYATDISAEDFGTDEDGKYLYLVITNKGKDSVLSITDLKFAYQSKPTFIDGNETPVRSGGAEPAPVRFMVDKDIPEAINRVLNTESTQKMKEAVIVDEAILIRHSLNLASDIAINYLVHKDSVAQYTNVRLAVTIPQYVGNFIAEVKSQILSPVEKGEYLYFTLEGLTAIQMCDEIQAMLIMEHDGQQYQSLKDIYSVSHYAYSQMEKAGSSPAFKKLCAELLRYGSAAQEFKGYRTDALADRSLTEEQRAYLTDLDGVLFGSTNSVGTDLTEPALTWVGKSLDLASKVGLKFVFSAQGYEGDIGDLYLRIRYVNMDGQPCEARVTDPTAYNEDKGQYAFLFDGLAAAELRAPVSVQIYHGNTPLSCTLEYSADTYGNGKTGILGQLCKALFAYSDSAKAYFTEAG